MKNTNKNNTTKLQQKFTTIKVKTEKKQIKWIQNINSISMMLK